MSNIRFQGNPSGTGTLTIASPNTNSDFTLNLPASAGTIPVLSSVTNNGVVFINSSGQATSGSGLVFDASGNLGLGVTPSAWSSSFKALNIGANGQSVSADGGQIIIGSNYVQESGGARYVVSAAAGSYAISRNSHAWYIAPSGTAGNAISFTQAMTLDASGNLGVGTTSLSNGVRTVIQGSQTGGAPQTSGTTQTFGLLRLQGTSFTSALDFGTNGGNYAWIQSTDQTNLATNYSLVLNPNGGNVGIGTSSPINLLTVQTAATGTTAGSNIIARFQSNAAGRDATLQLSDNVANSATISMVGGAVAVAQNGVERTRIDTSGNFQFNSGYGSVATAFGCRAWVNFNGTGTVAIRASGNVSSITDNGTGDYTVNFTNAMPDANSSVNVTCQRMDATSFEANYSGIRTNTSSNITTTSARVYTALSTTAAFDSGQVCVAVFR